MVNSANEWERVGERHAIVICMLRGIEETISNYMIALPITSFGCISSVLDNAHMPDTAENLQSNKVRRKAPDIPKVHSRTTRKW